MGGLTKSNTNKMISGVCGGLAEYYGWDATLIRLVFAFATVFAIGSPIIIYLIMAIVIPRSAY
jgi:phage shock protein C